MTQQSNPKSELRVASAMREINKAQRSIPTGRIGVFMRVTLAIVFMYLIVVSYETLGVAGPVFVSVLCLVSFFIPVLYQVTVNYLDQRRAQAETPGLGEETAVRQEV